MDRQTKHNVDLEQLAYIFELLPDGVYVTNQNFEVEYANTAFIREFGPYNNKKCYEYLCDGDRPCSECSFDSILSEKTIRSEWHCRKTGKIYDTTEAGLKQSDGRLLKVKIIHDITESKESRQRILDLSRFPEENPFPVLRISADGIILYSNGPGCVLLDEWKVEVGQTVPEQWRTVVSRALVSDRYQVQEVRCGQKLFSFAIAPLPEAGYVNLYGRDITAARQAVESLRESEQRLRAAARAAEFGTYDADLAASTIYWSPEFREIVGLPADAPAPKPGLIPDFIHPDDVESVRAMMQQAYDPQGNGEVDHEHRIIRPDGTVCWVLVQGQVQFGEIDGEKRAVRSTGIMLDITPFKEAEEALRRSESQFRAMFEVASVGIVQVNPADGRFIRCNEKYSQITGYSEQELSHYAFSDLTHPEDRQADWEKFSQAVRGETPNYMNEKRYVRKDGSVIWVRINAAFIRDNEGKPIRTVAICEDITDRKEAEQALQQSREDLNRAQEVANLGSWRLDVRKNELTWSDENHRIFGIRIGIPMTYETFLSTIHPDDLEYVDSQWRAALKGWPYDIEHRIIVDGHVKWVREKAYLEFDEQGELVGGFGISQDITQRKEIEDELRRAQDELENRVRQRTAQLADTVATLEMEVRQRIATEKALKQSEENYRQLIDVSPEAVCVIAEERIVFSNAAALKLVKAAQFDQLAGRPIWDFIHPASKEIVSRDVSDILSHHDRIFSQEISLVCLDGDIIDVEVSATAVIHQGRLGILAAYHDITERKRIQQRTRITNTLLELFTKKTSRKEYLDAVIHAIHDWMDCECIGIRLLDAEGKIPYEAWIGFSDDFLSAESGLSLYDHSCLCIRAITQQSNVSDAPLVTGRGSFHSGDVQTFIRELPESEKTGYRGHCIRHGFASLAVIPIRYRGSIIGAFHLADQRDHRFSAETVTFLEHIAMLVGEAVHRFNIEQSLQTSRTRLLEAQRMARIGNWEWNLTSGTVFWSDEIFRIIGVSPGEFEPTYDIFLSYVHPDDRPSIDEAVAAAKEQGTFAIDHRVIKPDGTVRYVHVIAEVMYDSRDEPVQMTGTIHDVTEQKQAEQAIREHQQSLRAMAAELQLAEERQRRQIAQDLHDSIGPILSFSTRELNSLKKQAPPELKAALEDISQKINKAIEQARTLSFDLSPSLLYDLGLEVAIEDLTDRFAAKNHIDCRFKTCPLPKPLAEDRQIILYRSVRELLINAAKYANASLIQVSVSRSDSNICIRVEDDGNGFDPRVLQKDSEKSKGFGLFSVRERLTHIGGTMDIESTPGQGTRVTLTAPVEPKNEEYQQES